MPSKLQLYTRLADHTATRITGSFQQWTSFLTTAARLYKYPYHEQLMIYAQRPEATACAGYELWNKQMGRYICRDSKGIALIDTSGDSPKLKYVFDVADTSGRENSRRLFLWEYRPEAHEAAVTDALEQRFNIPSASGLDYQLEQISYDLASDFWERNKADILDIVANSFLEEYDDHTIEVAFKNAVTVSSTYALMSRCGMEPERFFQHEDFMPVFDFNTPQTVAALGSTVSQISEQVLRQIEVTIKKHEREQSRVATAERTDTHDRTDLHPERGLSDSQLEPDRTGEPAPGQVREDAEEVPSGVSPGSVEPPAASGGAVPPSEGNRRSSPAEVGADDPAADAVGGGDGGTEGQRPDAVDGAYEHPESPSRGSDSEGVSVQLTQEDAPIQGQQFSFFPTEAEQIAYIDQAESVTPSAFSMPQEIIDHFLRLGSNTDHARMRIATEFMKQKSTEEIAVFLQRAYHGGYGLKVGKSKYAAWYATDGIHLNYGDSARYARTAQILSWEDAAVRIGQLLDEGRFATNVELAEAGSYERTQLAQSLWYMHHDLDKRADEAGYLPSFTDIPVSNYSDKVNQLAERLENTAFRSQFVDELTQFSAAYQQDRDLLRFHHYKPANLLNQLNELNIPRRSYASDMADVPNPGAFITEDEIRETLSRGSNFQGGKGRIYQFFLKPHTAKEKQDFLRNEYGTGGGNFAISRAGNSHEWHESKGIRYDKQNCARVELSWKKAAQYIDDLIDKDRFLSGEEKEQLAALEEAHFEPDEADLDMGPEQGPAAEAEPALVTPENPAPWEYNAVKEQHPDDIVLFQVGDFFEMYGEDARTAAQLLDLNLGSRPVPGVGRVEMCGIPAHALEENIEKLRQQHGVTISAQNGDGGERSSFSMAPIQAPAQEPDLSPPVEQKITQNDIDNALRNWNGDVSSKQAVAEYMKNHGRERNTAEWLSQAYGAAPGEPLHIAVDGAEMDLSWPKVQRRIAQLIKDGNFLTEQDAVKIPEQRVSQDEIDAAILKWNRDVDSKRAVVQYMAQHGQESSTADWLYKELDIGSFSDFEFMSSHGDEVHIPWPEVQQHIQRLIQEDRFLSEAEKQMPVVLGSIVHLDGINYRVMQIEHDELRDPLAYMREDTPPGVEPFHTVEPLPYVSSIIQEQIQHKDSPEQFKPITRELYEHYKPMVIAAVSQDAAYRNACGHSDRENAEIEGKAAVRRTVLHSGDLELVRIFSDFSEVRFRLLQEVVEETYPQLHELLRPLSQNDIDNALRSWNGDMDSKRAVVRYMADHAKDQDTAQWLAQEYGGDGSNNLFVVRAGSPEAAELPWEDVQKHIARLIDKDDFFTDQEKDHFENIDIPDLRERLEPGWHSPFVDQVMADVEAIAQAERTEDAESIAPPEPDPAQAIDPLAPAYKVGDTVYLDDKPFEITEVSDYNVQLRDPALAYPIFRAESKENFEQLLRKDYRNGPITEFLSADLNSTAWNLMNVLTGDGGLLGEDGKELVANWIRAGYGNTKVMQLLSDQFAGIEDSMKLSAGGDVDYRAYTTSLEISFGGEGNPKQSFKWEEIAPVLRAMYQLELVGFSHEPAPRPSAMLEGTPVYQVGDEVTFPYGDRLIHGKIHHIGELSVLVDTGPYSWSSQSVNRKHFDELLRSREENAHLFAPEQAEPVQSDDPQPQFTTEAETVYPAEENHLPYDVVVERLHIEEPEHTPPTPTGNPVSIPVDGEWQAFPNAQEAEQAAYEEYKENIRKNAQNFRIEDDHLGEGGPKAKFQANINAIKLLKELESSGSQALPEQQEVLSRYVGWGGLADVFDPEKENWRKEYAQLKELLTPEEYSAARSSTLNAHYTSPTVIKGIYEAVEQMGFQTGNILEPSMGVGNFFGLLPDKMAGSRLYGVELDSITGRIAKQLYPKANITVSGFEKTDRRDFYDLAIGNVPFGQYQVHDPAYNKLGFSIHNYFFAKSLDQLRPGGVMAFVTSRYTMDAKDNTVRKYLAERADFLGAIRLPNNAFKANAGTDVVSDIIFLQKRDRPVIVEPDWVHLAENEDGFAINQYFVDHPEMILGKQASASTQYGKQDFTVEPIEGANLSDQLHEAVKNIGGTYQEVELPDLGEGEEIRDTLPADPNVKNYSYTVVDDKVYFRENSLMVRPNLNATAEARVRGMVALRDCVRKLIDLQMDEFTPDSAIREQQAELNKLYDAYSAKYGLINDRANRLAFSDDSSYYLLCSLEILDNNNKLKRKADMFTKRTIKQQRKLDHVDTASEALAISIGEKACVDLSFMASLMGGSEMIPKVVEDLKGVIYKDPLSGPFDLDADGEHWAEGWQTADEYLSGNVRQKLRTAQAAAEDDPFFAGNLEALLTAQPKDLEASEIEVRLGATWLDKKYIQQFMYETFETPLVSRGDIKVEFDPFASEWQISNKRLINSKNVAAYTTYGTARASAYRLLEDALNLRDIRIYDTVYDEHGNEKRVLNSEQTTLAAQKQQLIRDAFRDWIWKDPVRRETLVKQYNEEMNSTRPREYDGSHITFSGMNPEITLREHQRNAIAHVLYGGNTLLAHEVGAGKTFEMVASAMESKRLGLCQKSIIVVPNHLTGQWASEFLQLYPSANILVTTEKDFETKNRKKFCARIATGDYDAVIIGHSQFERIPISHERQVQLIQDQIDEITEGLERMKSWENRGKHPFTVKNMERTKRGLEARLEKLAADNRKDDVISFEELGVDRMFVDESDNYKNLFLYTKMQNVAGLSTADAQKSSDMFSKCRYLDELTGGRGVIFATGTPVSNSMTEVYTIQRYLQYERLKEMGMAHFDAWASRFGESVTALELAPEGVGYRTRTRFARFFNLPELMNMLKEVADIKTADQLNLPTPKVEFHTFPSKPTETQKQLVQQLSKRASLVHSGAVDATQDNMLKITSDGRKLGLDQRLINPNFPDEEFTKVNQCVRNVLQFWKDGEADKLAQLVFCDISTPKKKSSKKSAGEPSFNVYDDIREKLIAGGMPPEQIAFIHDANTSAKKKALFAKVRSGEVRVLLGSTSKMGAGTNVQDRLIAIHDLDCPWRPRDLIQRMGRIVRQGNMNPLVHVCRYVTEGTFDAYLWQGVETKQKFIAQIMTSKSPVRSCEDVDETALSFAEIKALCAGDPRIKERMDLDIDVSRLKLMKADHMSNQFRLEDSLLKFYPTKIKEYQGFVRGLGADMETLRQHPVPAEDFVGMTVRGKVLTDKDKAGAALLVAIKDATGLDPVEIGSYRGLSMSITLEDFSKKYILHLKGEMNHRVELGTDARGNLLRIENVLSKIPERQKFVQGQLDNLYNQQAAAKEELGKPFPQEQELAQKTARLIELDVALNMDGKTAPEPEKVVAKSERPSVLDQLRKPRQDTHDPAITKSKEKER